MPSYTSGAESRTKTKQENPSSPHPHSGCSLCFVLLTQDKDWDLVKSSDKKVQRKHDKYASVSGWRSRAILWENNFRIKQLVGEGVCECVKFHNGKPEILSFLLDRRDGKQSILTIIWCRNFEDLNLPLSSSLSFLGWRLSLACNCSPSKISKEAIAVTDNIEKQWRFGCNHTSPSGYHSQPNIHQ